MKNRRRTYGRYNSIKMDEGLLKKVNRQLSDREKATMIWNISNVNWNDRLDALKELEKET